MFPGVPWALDILVGSGYPGGLCQWETLIAQSLKWGGIGGKAGHSQTSVTATRGKQLLLGNSHLGSDSLQMTPSPSSGKTTSFHCPEW
jgi:hypothetical protein